MKIKLLLIGLGLSACTSVLAQSPEAKLKEDSKAVVAIQGEEDKFLVNEEELEKALLQISQETQEEQVQQPNKQMQLLRYQMLINLLANRKRVKAQPQQPVVININNGASTKVEQKALEQQKKEKVEIQKKDKTIKLLNKRLAYLEKRLKLIEERKAKRQAKKRQLIIRQKKQAERKRLDSLEKRLQMLLQENADLQKAKQDTLTIVKEFTVRDTVRLVDTIETTREIQNTKLVDVASDFRREVFFSVNSTKLTAKAKAILSEAIRFMTKYPEARLTISGFASVDGRKESNLRLARRRQASVRAYLEAQGISAGRLVEETPAIDENVITNSLGRRVVLQLVK